MWGYVKQRTVLFYKEMLSSCALIIVFISLIIAKTLSNCTHGMDVIPAVIRGLLQCLPMLAGYYIICLFANDDKDIPIEYVKVDIKLRKKGLITCIIYFVFILTYTFGDVYVKHRFNHSIESIVPGLRLLDSFVMNNIAVPIAGLADFIVPHHIYMIIKGSIIYVLIPYLIFRNSGYNFKGMVFSMKHSRASWPIIGILLIMFAAYGISLKSIWLLIYSILYPGLCEEFFDRGIILRTINSFFSKRGNAMVAGSMFFMLIHIPSYYFSFSQYGIFYVISSLIQVLLMGILFGYGYSKTGNLLPWILIHALEDVGFLIK